MHCARGKKARTQIYPLQMTDILDRSFDKISMDLVSDHNLCIRESTHTNYHLSLNGMPRGFPHPWQESRHHHLCFSNPYHAKGYSQLVSTSAKHDYSCKWSKCSSMPSGTICLHWVFRSKIDSRRCYPLFIILYIFLRWGHSFLVDIVPVLCHTAKKMKTMKLS